MNVTEVTTEAPGARLPRLCGSGAPLTTPNLAVVNITLLAVAVPPFVTVIVATVFPALQERTVDVLMSGEPWHAPLQTSGEMMSENALTLPVSPEARSLTFKVQVPFGF